MARRETLDRSLDIDEVLERLGRVSTLEEPPQPNSTQDGESDQVQVVYDADGNPAWEITEETPQERMARLDARYRRTLSLIDKEDTLFEHTSVKVDKDAPDPVSRLEQKKGEFDPSVITLKQLKEKFKGYDFGPNGLVSSDSDQAKIYHLAIQAVQDGRIQLPTVDEYNEQLRQYNEKKGENPV